jgi:hypothetical protein
LYQFRGRLLTEEQDFCRKSELAQSPADLKTVQAGQSDIQQNQIRLQPFGLLDGFHPILSLDDLKLSRLLQQRMDESAELCKTIDYQYLKGLHYPLSPNQLEVNLRPAASQLDLPALSNGHCSYAVKPFQNDPRDVALRELETNEETRVVTLLAINHLGAHGRFFVQRSNLGLFTRMPSARGLDANAMRTKIIGVRFFVFFGSFAS